MSLNISKIKNSLSVIILCGGAGQRLRPLTEKVPKPLIKIKNKAILWNAYAHLKANKLKDTIEYLDMLSLNDMNKENKYIYYNIKAEMYEFDGNIKEAYENYLLSSEETSKTSRKNYIYRKLIKLSEDSNDLISKIKFIELLEQYTEETKKYGVVSGKEVSKGLTLVDKLVEKPEPEDAPSLLGILGRYIFTPDLFRCQKNTIAGANGEIQLTDAMQMLAQNSEIYAWTFNGKRYDIGTMKDWFHSHLELSATSEFSPILSKIIKNLSNE